MIRLELEKMRNAISRAKEIRPRVKVVDAAGRIYSVTSSNGAFAYRVRFAVANGMKLAECNCKAGQAGMICFHAAAAAAVNIGIQGMRRAVAS